MRRYLLKGAVGPKDNDSRYLLDVHRRDLPGQDTMRRYDDDDEVDLCVVGAGAGGSVLAQRLARNGWRVVIIEAGPFWHPDEDWVSDEAGSHELYWNQSHHWWHRSRRTRQEQLRTRGRGLDGALRGLQPALSPLGLSTPVACDGVGADWPIDYVELSSHYEQVERELPVSGQFWPWGDPHAYPFSPHPISEAASVLWRGAIKCGITMRVGPVGIVNGTFGNRPHCIYRGWCLQGCKVNAKASPYVTHLPDALEHGVEIRADSMASRVSSTRRRGRATGVAYIGADGEFERHQRAKVVAIAGYSIETPRLLLNSVVVSFSPRRREQRRPSGPLRDGPRRHTVRRTISRRTAHVQGATSPGLLRRFLRDGRSAWLRAWILDPDRLAATHWLGRARGGRRSLGTRVA